ncbi:MAG: hypothetical protein AVDCRST_MAG27-291 [uncultured Craurococcus sp.]|uniref:Uncharacterized protein n=1 Tax=uncultured Craurococcus sp. TaxID=1135998 RepID=A0A6J4HD78_9PROT|nr:MAG: hypothetical protein AVDCRST_MAG27-291 [uncultured Craurococcus sp.]
MQQNPLDRHRTDYPPEDAGPNRVIPCARMDADLTTRWSTAPRLAASILRN